MPPLTYYIRKAFILICSLLTLSGCAQQLKPVAENKPEEAVAADAFQAEITQYNRAISYLERDKFDQAESIFINFTQNRPDLAGPWANLALIEFKRGNIDAAEKLTINALKKNPDMAQALNLSGLIEKEKGNIKQALLRFQQAIQHDGDYAIAHYNLALLYDVYLQNIVEAVKHYQHYLKIINYSDEQTVNWLEELKYSLPNNS